MNYLHNDVKSENILVGHENTDLVYLIDFGLATRFLDPETGEHIPEEILRKFNGNFMFASKNQCDGFTNSRRSDIEAAFYLLIYMLNHSVLPWSCLSLRSDLSFTQLLFERTKSNYIKQLFRMTPSDLRNCLIKVLRLQFDEEPPYDYILSELQAGFRKAVLAQQPRCPQSSVAP